MAKNELHLYGTVGASWWSEDYFTPSTVRDELANMSGPITVRINSGGGVAADGQTIYSLLKDYPDAVDVVIDGMAASAASLIAMAGDTITMRLGSFMLIHDPAAPYTEGRGTEDDHRALANQLAITARGYAAIYAKRSGISVDEAREVMRAETLLDGAAALELGLATATDDQVQASAAAPFDYRMYAHAPRELRAASETLGRAPSGAAMMAMMAGRMTRLDQQKGMNMSGQPSQTAAEDPAVLTQTTVPADPAPATPEGAEAAGQIEASAQAHIMAERQRAKRINDAVMMAGLPITMAAQLIADGVPETRAIETITAKWKEAGDMDTPMHGRQAAKVGMEAREKFVQGATMALLTKSRLQGGERNEFSSLSLSELARASIEMAGERVSFDDRRKMIGHAFTMSGMHTTSDFANVLSNVMGKAALQGWSEAQETFDKWTRAGTLTDFKATKRVGAGLFDVLPKVKEGAEYSYGTVGDRGENIALATYGKILRISRQSIINDDLSILGDMPRKMGRAAKRTIGDLVYAILTGNPTLSDGVALFHSTHNNLAGAAAAPTVTSLATARAGMMTQKEKADGAALNIRPRYMLVPAALEVTAQQLLMSTVDPTSGKGHAMNPVANMAELIADARLDTASATAWYLAADPQAFDTIEVAYLDGVQEPYIEEQTAWTSDGVEIKVRMDAGVAPLDFRTLYKNAGA